MTTSLTGGYDVCIEIGDAVLRAAAAPLLANDAVQKPSIPVSFASGGRQVTGTLKLFVTRFGVNVVAPTAPTSTSTSTPAPPAAVQLVLSFQGGALQLTAPAHDSAGGLDGDLYLTIPISLATPSATRRDLTLELDAIRDVTVVLHDDGRHGVEALANRQGVPQLDMIRGIDQAVTDQTGLLSVVVGQNPVLNQFRLVGGDRDGSIQPLRFVDLTLATARGSDPFDRRVLAVFGTFVRDHAGQGRPLGKTQVLTDGETSDCTVIVDPDAFRRVVFCPQVLRSFIAEYLAGRLPDDFLATLPESAFDPFLAGLTGADLDARRRRIDGLVAGHHTKAFFDAFLPHTLPVDLTTALGPGITAALPPALADLLVDVQRTRDAVLPPECGQADVYHIKDAMIVQLGVVFLDGKLRVQGHILPDKLGIEGDLDFWADITLTLANGKIVPTAGPPQIRSGLVLAWWAYVASLGIFVWIVRTIEAFANVEAYNRTKKIVTDSLDDFATVTVALPRGVTATSVQVTPDALVIRADAPSVALPPIELPSMALTSHFTESGRDLPARAVEIHNECVNGKFRVHEHQRQTRYTFDVTTANITPPVTFAWFVEHHAVEGQGDLRSTTGDVLLHFAQSGPHLEVWNEWDAPQLIINGECRATGSDGTAGSVTFPLYFEGSSDVYDDAYGKAIRPCIEKLIDSLDDLFAVAPAPTFGRRPVDRDTLVAAVAGARGGAVDPVGLQAVADAARLRGTNPAWLRDALRADALRTVALTNVVRRGPLRPG